MMLSRVLRKSANRLASTAAPKQKRHYRHSPLPCRCLQSHSPFDGSPAAHDVVTATVGKCIDDSQALHSWASLGTQHTALGAVAQLTPARNTLAGCISTGGGVLPMHTSHAVGPQACRSLSSAADSYPPHQVLAMPSLSPTMTQGNLIEWKKKEGDAVTAGDVLCSLETDKATLDNEAQDDGFLAKILVPAGSKDVPVGTAIAILVDDEADLAKFASYQAGGTASASASPAAASATPAAAAPTPAAVPSVPPHHLGPSVKILLETFGIDPSRIVGTGPHGIITKGDVLAANAAGVSAAPHAAAAAAAASAPPPPAPAAVPAAAAAPAAPAAGPPAAAAAAPLAAAAAATSAVPPAAAAAPPTSSGPYEDIPTTQIRRIIAQRLLESKQQSPHLYAESETIIDATLALRKQLKELFKVSVSVNDFVIKAVASALKEVPEANVFWDDKEKALKKNDRVDISIAVATEKGLLTPIVKNADQKSLSAISAEVKDLAERARKGSLLPEDFQGGSFTISNLGMFAVDRFSAIINPPQAGILAVGRGEKVVRPSASADGPATPESVTKLEMTVSADARAMGADVAGKLLSAIGANLRDPRRLLI